MADTRLGAFLWDLDTTLADTQHRRPLLAKVKASEATWEDYSLAAADDVPREAAVVLMRSLVAAQHIVISGRSEVARDLTWAWFSKHNIPVDDLVLRPEGDYSPNAEFKVKVIEHYKAHVRPIMYFEDWPPAAKAIREQCRIPVLTINPEYPDMCTCGYMDQIATGVTLAERVAARPGGLEALAAARERRASLG